MSTLDKEGTGTADEFVESGQRFYDEHSPVPSASSSHASDMSALLR
ncbi:MAG TPA: hypothetical protein VIQ24_04930 [Pyrinomonadaceae bacterium]